MIILDVGFVLYILIVGELVLFEMILIFFRVVFVFCFWICRVLKMVFLVFYWLVNVF